jgi:hypothetical protein
MPLRFTELPACLANSSPMLMSGFLLPAMHTNHTIPPNRANPANPCGSELARDGREADMFRQDARGIVNDHREQARSHKSTGF